MHNFSEQLCRRILRNSMLHEEHINQLTEKTKNLSADLMKCIELLEKVGKLLPEVETDIIELVSKSKDDLQNNFS